MFLKSLILRGFKTFADKIEMDFIKESGITAVVGPNGCGKSNFVDAFRFTLGEGNFRELRVNSLPEVIFAGTILRKPLSLAEATLIFDNSSGRLPINYSEVAIKRRTFRDGTSEFFINQQTCRLKDIRTLFFDTGISFDSLSIISQGRVDAILVSRPEDRRAFFEEVAGVHKYRTRKYEVERKLIICEQNLLRISDLKVEIGEQYLILEAQARSAKEYKEKQVFLHNLEIGIFKKQVMDILEKKEEIEKRLIGLKQQAQEISAKTKELMDGRTNLKEKIKSIEQEIESTLIKIDEAKEKIDSEQSSLLIERERAIFAEKSKMRDLLEEEKYLRFEISKCQESLQLLKTRKAEIENQVSQWSEISLGDFKDLQSTIELGLKVIKQINSLAEAFYGREGIILRSQSEDRVREMFEKELSKIKEEELVLRDNLKYKEKEAREISERKKYLEESFSKIEVAGALGDRKILNEYIKTKDDLLIKLEELRAEKNLAQRSLDEMENQPASSIQEGGELVGQEIALARISGELLQIEDRLQSEYGLSRESLLASPHSVSSLTRGKKETEELRQRLRELEPVNLLAIEEFERVKERHNFIEGQSADLALARENLKTLIADLDIKAREDFLSTIEKVTKNFKEIFAGLFDGGEATIEVNENEGIEISVCPSGRKWLNLSLLSGGERALTAIALLLAFLKTQPSPLCILDEVDAALDEANVARFARFLKDFSSKTQMIVITHNRRTMEVADVIYGITMEEPGVSKVVSMRLEKVS